MQDKGKEHLQLQLEKVQVAIIKKSVQFQLEQTLVAQDKKFMQLRLVNLQGKMVKELVQ